MPRACRRRVARSRLAGGIPVVFALVFAGAASAQSGTAAYEGAHVTDGGTLTGTVTFTGEVPEPTEIMITRDFEICGMGFRARRDVDVAEGGELRNVVIFVEGIDRGKPWPDAPEGHVLDQKDCYFEPYLQVVPQGAELRIVNSDAVLHNIHGYELSGRARRTLFNLAQPDVGEINRPLRPRRGRQIGLECDAHDFMLGWIFAADNPYVAVVDDDGRFTIDGVPPGTYTVGAWHPFLGVRQQEVSLAAGAAGDIAFEFTAD